LTKGTYTLFVYEDCNSCPSGEQAVTRTVEIDENNATVEVEDLIIEK
jgi:hypothetical protein